jgi:hypothetical protein
MNARAFPAISYPPKSSCCILINRFDKAETAGRGIREIAVSNCPPVLSCSCTFLIYGRKCDIINVCKYAPEYGCYGKEPAMCNFLYGCINEKAYDELFLRISHDHSFVYGSRIPPQDMFFNPGIEGGVYFRITNNYCDCGTVLGGGDEKAEELQAYIRWLKELRKCQKHGMKAFYIMKFWEGGDGAEGLKPVVTIHIEEADAAFLAGIEEDRVYRVEYFKRYSEEYAQ